MQEGESSVRGDHGAPCAPAQHTPQGLGWYRRAASPAPSTCAGRQILLPASQAAVMDLQRAASKVCVWCPGPSLLWYRGLPGWGHSVPSLFQFPHLPQQLQGIAPLKLPARYEAPCYCFAAVTGVVSIPLVIFWQSLLMTSLNGNPLENRLFLFLLPLSAFLTSTRNCYFIPESASYSYTAPIVFAVLCNVPQFWAHRPFLVQDVKPTTKGHGLKKGLFSFK